MSAKKGSKKEVSETAYSAKDTVLGKIKGYPPWPGQVVEPEGLPDPVLRERPSGKKTTHYCVQFFPAGDYAWLSPKDISRLQKHEIESYINEPYKKSGDLLTGYRCALDPSKWEETRLAQMADINDEEEDEDEEAPGEVDELASGDEGTSLGKKRKKTASAIGGGGKRRKREETTSVSAVGGPKVGRKKAGESASAKKGTKTKKNSAKSKDVIESEDDGGAEAEEESQDKKATSPPSKKGKKEDEDPEAVKVREWRHKLQKTFLSNKGPPKETDMPAMDTLFTTIENYEQMTIQYLSFSKIGKVMRHIAALDPSKAPIPKEDEFKFKQRAKVLVDKWHLILGPKENGEESKQGVNGTGDAEPKEDTEMAALNGDDSADNKADADADGDVDLPATNGAMSPKDNASQEPEPLVEEEKMDTA